MILIQYDPVSGLGVHEIVLCLSSNDIHLAIANRVLFYVATLPLESEFLVGKRQHVSLGGN